MKAEGIDPMFIPNGYEPIVFRDVDEFRELAANRDLWEAEDGRRIFQPFNADGSMPKEFQGYVAFVKVAK